MRRTGSQLLNDPATSTLRGCRSWLWKQAAVSRRNNDGIDPILGVGAAEEGVGDLIGYAAEGFLTCRAGASPTFDDLDKQDD